jgi:archaemetzincin
MKSSFLFILTLSLLILSVNCSFGEPDKRAESLQQAVDKLRPLHKKLEKPRSGDWLDAHEERGQTFLEYISSNPVVPTDTRRTIYVQPLGDFSSKQREIIVLTADFLGRYFCVPVKVKKDLPLSMIPSHARRVHPSWGDKQVHAGYVLRVIRSRLPEDALACIALTASDLWPGEGWNFVFGLASLKERVGVWSIFRFGDPEKSVFDFQLCLLRALKTATHETGHMISMAHCIEYQCNMNGSNHMEESDRNPLSCCPECAAKICWASKTDPVERYRKLEEFCRKQGLKREQEFYEKSIKALEGK